MKGIRDSMLLAGKDLMMFFKDPVGLVLGFLLPIALVTVFGTLMAYAFGGSSGAPKISLKVVDLDQTESSKKLVKALADSGTLRITMCADTVADPEATVRKQVLSGDVHHGLIIDPGYAESLAAGQLPTLRMLRDPGRGLEDRIIQFSMIQSFMSLGDPQLVLGATRRLFAQQGMDASQLDQLNERFVETGNLIQGFLDTPAIAEDPSKDSSTPPELSTEPQLSTPPELSTPSGSSRSIADQTDQPAASTTDPMAFIDQILPIESEDLSPPDRNVRISYQQAQSISGMSVMMLLFGLVNAGTVLLKEREEGTLRRLFSLPIRREAVLWGKGISLFVIGSIQLIVFFVYGELVFRVGLFQQPLTLAVLIVTWVAVAASFAMMLATTCRSAKQAEGLATILILVMSALGGCWFPTHLMSLPGWLESATRIVPTYWAMTGFQGMMWNQLTLGSPKVLGAISIQWLFVALLSAFSVIMFRRNYCRDLA